MFFQKIIDFLKNLFSSKDVSEIGEVDVSSSVDSHDENPTFTLEEFLFVQKNNLLDKINTIRTKLSRIELVCNKEYVQFSTKLDILEKKCTYDYSEYAKAISENKLVFTCEPDFNNDFKQEISKLDSEVDEFINSVGKYKVLEDRLKKMSDELSKYYEEYKRGDFKGDFLKLISFARSKVTDLIERVMGEKSNLNQSQTFLEKKALNDTYIFVLYLIEKCEIYYMVTYNTIDTQIIKNNFKESFLIFIMKDMEIMKGCIDSLSNSLYYNELTQKFQKLKSIDISNMNFIDDKTFFVVFVSIEKIIAKVQKNNKSNNNAVALLNLLNS